MQICNYIISPRRTICGFLFPGTSECVCGGNNGEVTRCVHYMADSEKVETWKFWVEVLNSTFGRGCWRVALTVAQELLII